MTVLIVVRTLPRPRLKSNHRRPHLLAQTLPVLRLEAGGGNGRRDQQLDRPAPQSPGSLGQDLECVVDVDRHERHLGRDRQTERRVLEGQQLTGAAARPFRKNDDRRHAVTNRPRRCVVGLERFFAGGAVDRDVARRAHSATQERNLEQLLLRDEANRAGQCREQRPDVEHRRVVRRVHERLPARDELQPFGEHGRAGSAQDLLGPVDVGPIVDAADCVLDAEDAAEDGAAGVNDGGDEENYIIPERADHWRWAKGSYPAGNGTDLLWSSRRTPPRRPPAPRRHVPMRVRCTPVCARNDDALASPKAGGIVSNSSNSSPLDAAIMASTFSQQGMRSRLISMPTSDAAARCWASATSPSEMSIIAVAP